MYSALLQQALLFFPNCYYLRCVFWDQIRASQREAITAIKDTGTIACNARLLILGVRRVKNLVHCLTATDVLFSHR